MILTILTDLDSVELEVTVRPVSNRSCTSQIDGGGGEKSQNNLNE
jgi:hypothetical protein